MQHMQAGPGGIDGEVVWFKRSMKCVTHTACLVFATSSCSLISNNTFSISYRYHTTSSNLSYLTVYYSTLSYSIVHSYLTLLYTYLAYSTLHYLVLPSATPPYPTQPNLSRLHLALPHPTLPHPVLHHSAHCLAFLYIDVDFPSSCCTVADHWKNTEGAGALAQGREEGQG